MPSEFSDNNKQKQPESALGGISESILRGVTAPVELFVGHNDQKTRKDLAEFRENAQDYLKEGLKTAAMFMRGKTGLIGTVATQALDEWKPEDKKHQWVDLGLGAAKGAALTYIFRKTAMVDSNIKFFPKALDVPLNAAKLGLYTRIPSIGLSRSTWFDENEKFDANRTGSIIAAGTGSIVTDVVAGVATHGLLKGTNHITGDAVKRSPMLSTVLTGSGFGMSNGAAQEILRQTEEQKQFNPLQFNYWKIGQSALIQGAVDSIAAIPGGRQAEHEALRTYNGMRAGAEPVKKVPSFKRDPGKFTELKEKTDSHSDTCSMCLTKPELESTAITHATGQSSLDKFDRIDAQTQRKLFKTTYDDKAKTVVQRLDDFIVYHPKDHDLMIGVPKAYNNQLIPVRELRALQDCGLPVKTTEMGERALPEDLIPCLDAVPNSLLIKSIYLHNDGSPHELKDGPGQFGYAIADANKHGHINYYMHPGRESMLRETTNHEFGHLVHFKFPEADVAFICACELENALSIKNTQGNANPYATKNEMENFAVHFGEVLLHASPEKFIEALEYAPTRMAILAKALKATLTEIPQAKVSLHHKQLLARAEIIEQYHTPQIVESLLKEIQKHNSGEDPAINNYRLQVLAYLGEAKHAQKLVNLARVRAADPEVLLDAGYRMCRESRDKQLDFLLKMTERTNSDVVRELALQKFTESEIKSHFLPSVMQSYKTNRPLYLRRLNDLSTWYEMNSNPEKSEHYARMAVDESITSPNPETIKGLNKLIDSIIERQEYFEVEKYMLDSVKVSKKLYGEMNEETGYHLNRLGSFLFNEGRYQEALPFLVRKARIERSTTTPDWEQHKYTLEDLAECCRELGLEKGLAHFLKEIDFIDAYI